MIFTQNEINNIILKSNIHNSEYYESAGKEHYKLLAYLSLQFNNKIIIDIGTHKGYSASALGYNNTNTVYTFDICDKLSTDEKNVMWYNNNVIFNTDNLFDNNILNKWKDTILNSSLIFLDIDPHDGYDEYEFYKWLKESDYKGILILDDIWYFKNMRDNLWFKIPSEYKLDLTEIGHWSGTGLVNFNKNNSFTMCTNIQNKNSINNQNKNWTIVTAYFNLTKMPDASDEIKARDIIYYMKHANMTMSLDQNLIVYCDSESESHLRSLRPEYLQSKTKYIIIEFEELQLVKSYYNILVNSRNKTKYNADNRNTPSYYLFCMIRYEILLDAIKNNPFNSTHFAWCNICIERMNWKNCIYFPKIWNEFRDKFSTCYIDYQPRSLVIDNIKEYYLFGRCSMCSGFFTGNIYYMSTFCNKIIEEFDNMLKLDVGHADEQLFSIVYFKNPELFEFYYGDYTEMIVNYGWIIDRAYEPVKNIMRNLIRTGENWPLLYDVTSRWLSSYYNGCFTIDKSTLDIVKNYKEHSIKNM